MHEQITTKQAQTPAREVEPGQYLTTEEILGGILVAKTLPQEEIQRQLEDMLYMG